MARKKRNKFIWIEGNSCCGKTDRLVELFSQWAENITQKKQEKILPKKPLIICANSEGKKHLLDNLLNNSQKLPFAIEVKTPFGFMIDEVELYFPLIVANLNINPQIPLILRPETEQELASNLWRDNFSPELLTLFANESTLVRRLLDLLQLAGCSGVAPEEIPTRLKTGKVFLLDENNQDIWDSIGELLFEWRKYCLERGLLSYGIIYELYWRYLLTDSNYKGHLLRRYGAVFADDLDDYPGVSADVFKFFIEQNIYSVFTYNNKGKVRLGLNADPDYLKTLSLQCDQEFLNDSSIDNLAVKIELQIKELMGNNHDISMVQDHICSVTSVTRSHLIQSIIDIIINEVNNGKINPHEIAIIAPGLDEVARFNFIHLLQEKAIPIEPLKEQRPLISSPLVRAILSLLGLLYRGNGRLIERDMIAQMLVVLSPQSMTQEGRFWDIDPVRGGLLADYCYYIDIESPCLLSIEHYPSGDRMNYKTFVAYNEIRDWVEITKAEIENNQLTPLVVIDKILQRFFPHIQKLTYSQLASLRELRETANHFWQVYDKLENYQPSGKTWAESIGDFIVLLRKGTITANPYPVDLLGKESPSKGITLATIYQYRTSHLHHRWQFWLDAGSNLWGKGGAAKLVASSLFLRGWDGKPFSVEDEAKEEKERIERIIHDLLSHSQEKIFLCHSQLDINGNQQMGNLLGLIYLIPPFFLNKS